MCIRDRFQTQRYRQQIRKEEHILANKTKADIQKLDDYFNVNNNYLATFRKETAGKPSNALKETGFLSRIQQDEKAQDDNFWQKLKRDTNYPHKTEELAKARDMLKFPLTSNQSYGWRAPYDDLNFGYGLKSNIKDFYTNVTFRKPDQKERGKTVEPTKK
eukprot:TRINITY_DN841_c0_g1_i4.p1 TRINITY_DN841_c0_g1~~TRINITY_DN841_c0_g1_i4.p1  ORF type:complete len:160 (+),score=45.07 TRINITY_DN841_c0_g1_i4:66-545(+)